MLKKAKLLKNPLCVQKLQPNDKIRPEEIKNNLKTIFTGREIIYFEKTDSTNTVAKDLAKKGFAEGTVVIADEQSKGRGRLKRSWLSEPGKNILMSIIFRPDIPFAKAFTLTMIASIAIVKAIKKTTGLKISIKWPNDIYYSNKKLAGILTELDCIKDKINYAIVGIGLNVNSSPEYNPEIQNTATSLIKEYGKIISRDNLLLAIFNEIEKQYLLLKKGEMQKIQKEWNRYSLVTGKAVKIIYSDNKYEEGIAESISEEGALILLKKNNEKKIILCGDVSLRM